MKDGLMAYFRPPGLLDPPGRSQAPGGSASLLQTKEVRPFDGIVSDK